MHSILSYIIPWFVWFRFKPSFASASALHARIQRERKTLTHHPPQSLRTRLIVDERQDAKTGHPVYDIAPKSETPHRARVMYIHGGAFVFEILDIHWNVVAEIAEALNAIVTVPIYPLAPEHGLDDMYAMLQPVHDEMAEMAARENVPFLMVGESCGASLGLAVTQQAQKKGKPVCERMVLTTPVVDSSLTNPDMRAMAQVDPFHDMPGFEEVLRMIGKDRNPKDPLVSPIYGDLSKLPPMLVSVAEKDLLAPDARRFIAMARDKNREVEVIEGEGMIHVWPDMPIYEGQQARKRMMEWFESAIS